VTLLELASLYRSLASGLYSEPWLLERVTAASGLELYRHVPREPRRLHHPSVDMIQEALRGAIRLPRGTGHALASLDVPVMGKTGTTNDFRDALFVGATYGPSGVTVAVRVGFDDNRPLGPGETGARVALPIFKDAMVGLYARGLLGSPPPFPAVIEEGIDAYLAALDPTTPPPDDAAPAVAAPAAASGAPGPHTATPGSKD
jgi:penicillin-binding protein 1A